MNSPEFHEASLQTHHKRSSVAKHTINVTSASLHMCYVLEKLRISVSVKDVVIGSLCHDLGILNRDTKYANNRSCYIQHPNDSMRVAQHLVPDINDKSLRIIRNHMWPITITKVPRSKEEIIVSLADKYAAMKDIFISKTSMVQ